MTIITDKTIDTSTAEYWCLFADKKLQLSLSKIMVSKKQSGSSKTQGKSSLDENIIMTALGYASYLFTAISLAGLVAPYLKNMWRKMTKGSGMKIAEVKFEADGSNYAAWFDADVMKWQLHSEASVTPQETMQFFETQFFLKFNLQCASYIVPILLSKESILKNMSKILSNEAKKALNKLLDNDKRIMQNMFDAKYLT